MQFTPSLMYYRVIEKISNKLQAYNKHEQYNYQDVLEVIQRQISQIQTALCSCPGLPPEAESSAFQAPINAEPATVRPLPETIKQAPIGDWKLPDLSRTPFKVADLTFACLWILILYSAVVLALRIGYALYSLAFSSAFTTAEESKVISQRRLVERYF